MLLASVWGEIPPRFFFYESHPFFILMSLCSCESQLSRLSHSSSAEINLANVLSRLPLMWSPALWARCFSA